MFRDLRISLAEVEERGWLDAADALLEYPWTELPGGCFIVRPRQSLIHVGPGAVLQIDPGIQSIVYRDNSASFSPLGKGGKVFGILTTVDVRSMNVRRITLDARKTHADPAILIAAA